MTRYYPRMKALQQLQEGYYFMRSGHFYDKV